MDYMSEFHVRFEGIHPFQDGNGRIGRLIMLKECLKYNHTPFVIAENLRQFYYKGLVEWRKGAQVRLKDTCGTGQDIFKAFLSKFGYSWLVKGATQATRFGPVRATQIVTARETSRRERARHVTIGARKQGMRRETLDASHVSRFTTFPFGNK